MNIHETTMFTHIMHVYTYIHTPTHVQIYRHTNKIARTHITSLLILLHRHVCIGIYAHARSTYVQTHVVIHTTEVTGFQAPTGAAGCRLRLCGALWGAG